ncbi:MAG: phosphotransferase family protein [Acidimicrobiia bacterium]
MIPVEVDEVTPAWLSEALGADVAAVEVVDRHSGTTGRARVAITYGRETSLPSAVFVKLAPFDERQRRFVDLVGLGLAEARFYRDLAPDVPVRIPDVLHASLDDDGRYVMVLEDLVASGCAFPSPHDDDIAETAGRIVDELAVLHARFWESPALTAGLGWVSEGHRLGFGGGGPFIQRAVDRFADEMPPAFRRLGELYVAVTPRIAELYEAGPLTLAHGDPHLGNLFVDRGRPGFYDWGMVMRRAGMWDVAYVICNGLPPEIRRAHEREWIDRYRAGLASEGVQLDAGVAWQQYRLFAVYAWSSATSTAGVGSRWQPEAYGRQGMEAATAAIDDLDSIELLEALLG